MGNTFIAIKISKIDMEMCIYVRYIIHTKIKRYVILKWNNSDSENCANKLPRNDSLRTSKRQIVSPIISMNLHEYYLMCFLSLK